MPINKFDPARLINKPAKPIDPMLYDIMQAWPYLTPWQKKRIVWLAYKDIFRKRIKGALDRFRVTIKDGFKNAQEAPGAIYSRFTTHSPDRTEKESQLISSFFYMTEPQQRVIYLVARMITARHKAREAIRRIMRVILPALRRAFFLFVVCQFFFR